MPAREIALPKLLILLCILAVFAPALVMEGVPEAMFMPLSLAVGFAMVASFLLSQTFVPVMANWLLKSHPAVHQKNGHDEQVDPTVTKGFERFKHRYQQFLGKLVRRPKRVIGAYFLGAVGLSVLGFRAIGTDIFPLSNSPQFQLRIRETTGTRFEQTEKTLAEVTAIIKKEVNSNNPSADAVEITSAFVGTQPASYAVNSIFVFTSGPHEALLQVAMTEHFSGNVQDLKESLRRAIARQRPDLAISFEPIELVEKVMSDGASTPIQVNVGARNLQQANAFAQQLMDSLKRVPYLRDVQIAQPLRYPVMQIDVDRQRAAQFGVTSQDITRSMVATTSSSRFTNKNLWLDPVSGLGYQVQVQVPENQLTQVQDIENIPVKPGQSRPTILDVATISPGYAPGEIDRSGPYRLVSITANIQNKDLGTATKAVRRLISKAGTPPKGVVVNLVGQSQLLDDTLGSLQSGLLVAIVVIFLLLAANFQSFKLAAVILGITPAVIAGALGMLLASEATLNLQSYMGIIMSVGVSVSNAILLITSAEGLRLTYRNARSAVIEAAGSRIRPILMTSIAMIAGMIPMALGLGEGGEQVAPLGQAVIGGLLASTVTSLLILPALFAWTQKKAGYTSVSLFPEPAIDIPLAVQ